MPKRVGSDRSGIPPARVALPQPRHRLVARERLFEALSRGTLGPVTVIYGAAGSGKTLAAAAWASAGGTPGPVAWLRLDEDARAPGIFWAYVIASLRAANVDLGDSIGTPVAGGVDQLFLAHVAAALTEQGRPTVLILDDFDAVEDSPVGEQLLSVVADADPALRLVVIGRAAPSLGLARLRAAGTVSEIGPADLAFTEEEAATFFRQQGLRVPTPAVAALTAKCDGWITALRLSGLALQRGGDPDALLDGLHARHGDVASYLLSEIVDQQRAETADLLLRTCLLDEVSGGLADALTGRSDGDKLLLELSQTTSFVRPVNESAGWYRYHGLLAEALRGRLLSTRPELVADLHRAASRWLADSDRLRAAVSSAVAAGDWSLAAAEIIDDLAVAELMVGLDTERLGRLFRDLPDSADGPDINLVRASIALGQLDAWAARDALDRAEIESGSVAPRRRQAFWLAGSAVRVTLCRITGDLQGATAAAARFSSAWDAAPQERRDHHPELAAMVWSSLGTVQLWAGAADLAEATLETGISAAVSAGTEQPRSNCLAQLALARFLRGDLRRAQALATESITIADRAGLLPAARVAVGNLVTAAIAWEWNDEAAAAVNLQRGAATDRARLDPLSAALLAWLRARMGRTPADSGQALRERLATARAALPRGSFMIALLIDEETRGWLAAKNPARAMALLELLPPDEPVRRIQLARLNLLRRRPQAALQNVAGLPGERTLPSAAIQALLIEGECHTALGDSRQARLALQQALKIARPGGYRRPFADAAWVPPALAAAPDLAAAHAWLGEKLVGRPARPAGAQDDVPPIVTEPLTPRETDVLRLLATPMSSKEVAAELHLSLNTVKTHLRSAYRKLAASSRTEAIRRARTLGMF